MRFRSLDYTNRLVIRKLSNRSHIYTYTYIYVDIARWYLTIVANLNFELEVGSIRLLLTSFQPEIVLRSKGLERTSESGII